ncbi:unnamed protein product [Caenorhabditis auriculariae]|uniref:C-type lectin domain-containing protein n=1 Tax=Caenorhabditis auriculariae TaxID=2777116 RepID=A0A8S1HYW2_9PELO|nr:unnamed protein product [Caenorhabditis auriculariae]
MFLAFIDNTWRYYPRTCSCYKILNSTYFEQAQEDCSNLFPGSNLVSIHSDSEAIFVSDMVIAAIENDNWEVHHDGEDDTIIGLYRTEVGAPWQHTDHTPYDFFPWIAPDTSINNNYGTLITSSAPGYRGFGGVYSTENYIIRTAVCKYQL